MIWGPGFLKMGNKKAPHLERLPMLDILATVHKRHFLVN